MQLLSVLPGEGPEQQAGAAQGREAQYRLGRGSKETRFVVWDKMENIYKGEAVASLQQGKEQTLERMLLPFTDRVRELIRKGSIGQAPAAIWLRL